MSATNFTSIDEFLNHSGTERRGGGGTFLRGWKKNGHIEVWLHTKRLPVGLWQHRFPKLVVREDRDTRAVTKSFFSQGLTCWESETVLKKQYHLLPDGTREAPPNACPLCKLIDHVRLMVDRGQLSWTAPVFEFKGSTDPKDDVVLHAGGLYNAYASDDLDQDDLNELKRAGISQRSAFRENALARLGYVFCLVQNDKPGEGVQIAVETKLLGSKVQQVINDTIASLGAEEGNPVLNPYCIQFVYDENAKAFGDMYKARRIERHRMTPEIEKLIKGEAPDLSNVVARYNAKSLRAVCEQYAKVKLPWDEIFSSDQPTDYRLEESVEEEIQVDVSRETLAASTASHSPAAMVPCDGCHKLMPEDASKCEGCGATYSFDEPAPPPPPPVRRGQGSGAKLPF